MSSSKKLCLALLATGTDVSSRNVSRRLLNDFDLKSCKPARKPRLAPAMKVKRLAFTKTYVTWSLAQWSRVLFSDESSIQQFNPHKCQVWRPVGKHFDKRYTVQTMKHPPSVMIWGAMSVTGTAGLFFLPNGTTMNGQKYVDLLKDKLELHMNVHNCNIFMQDGAPCHRSRLSASS